MTNVAGFYPGPEAPSTADVSPIWATLSSQFELVPRGQLRLAVKRNDWSYIFHSMQVDEFEEELVNSNALQFALGPHSELNPTPIIINGGYHRLQTDAKTDQAPGSAYPADP